MMDKTQEIIKVDMREWFNIGTKLKPIMEELGKEHAELNEYSYDYIEWDEADIDFEAEEIYCRLYTKSGRNCYSDDYYTITFCFADIEPKITKAMKEG